MNCLAWNNRGLENIHIWKDLGDIIRAKDPLIVFIAKTWVDEVRFAKVQREIDFEHKWVVPGEGMGGVVLSSSGKHQLI